MTTRIKICGITNSEDAQACVKLGVHALGFVFYAKSARYIDVASAQSIIRQLPPFVTTVGLFVNHAADEIHQIISQVDLDLLQFHGDESASFCEQFNRPYIKAIGIKSSDSIISAAQQYSTAKALLLDKYDPIQLGGTGECFDWSLVPSLCAKPLILAGGLTPENVADAICLTSVYAVDVSSGVEISKGIKDHYKISKFVKEVSSVK